MSEEKAAMVGDRIELRFDTVENKLTRLKGLFEQLNRRVLAVENKLTRLKGLFEELARRVLAVENKLARLEGLFDQMDRRVSSLEQLQRQGLGIMVGAWVSLMLAVVLGLYFKG